MYYALHGGATVLKKKISQKNLGDRTGFMARTHSRKTDDDDT
jgi:hypothetical protein